MTRSVYVKPAIANILLRAGLILILRSKFTTLVIKDLAYEAKAKAKDTKIFKANIKANWVSITS